MTTRSPPAESLHQVFKEEEPPAEPLLWNQEEPGTLEIKEEQEELKVLEIKEEETSNEELRINEGLEKTFLINSKPKEPPWIKQELEEPEPPWIKQELEEPEPPWIKQELEEPEPPWIKQELEEPEPPWVHRGRLKEEAGLPGLLDLNRRLVIKLHRIDSLQPPGSCEVDPSGNSKPTPEPLPRDVSQDQPGIPREDPPRVRRWIGSDACSNNTGVGGVHAPRGQKDREAFGKRPARKPQWCQDCGKSFTQHSSLMAHVRIHTGEKPFSCPTCGRSFSQKSSLLIHGRIHSGEKPFSCPTCGKGFSQRYGLLRHTRSHTGERPHPCPVCKKSFGQSYHLKKHMRVHARQGSCTA